MADSNDTKAEVSAEKAYAAAAEAIGGKDGSETAEDKGGADRVEFPAKPKRTRKPAVLSGDSIADEMGSEAAADAPPAPVAMADEAPEVAPEPPPSRPRVAAKPAKAAVKPMAKRVAAKPAVAKRASAKTKTAAKTAKPFVTQPRVSDVPKPPLIAQLKEIPMDMTANVKEAVNGAQEKAKEAFTKTSAAFGEYGEFAKGNVEAFVESSKILASGLQDLSSKFLADSKAAFETTVADVKELSAAKTPTDFLKLQTEVMRRNFDSAIAYGSKTSEAMLKLTNDVFAPISSRVSLAVDKVRKAA